MADIGQILVAIGLLISILSTTYSFVDEGLTQITYFGIITTAILTVLFVNLVVLN